MTHSARAYRILFVITRADTMAGAQTHVLEMSVALMNAGHSVLVLCGKGAAFTDRLAGGGVEFEVIDSLTRTLSVGNDLKATFQLIKEVKQYRPDLVSLHSSKAGILGRLVCKILRTPVIFTAHGWAFAEGVGRYRARVYSSIERKLQFFCKKIICVSRADLELAVEYGFDRGRLITVHNGRHDRYEERENTGSVVTISMIGRLDSQKDHDSLLTAVSVLDGFVLRLIGDGPRLDELKVTVDKLGIQSKVKFDGLVKDVSEILIKSDIFVLSSHWEGFPRSTLEAMSCQLPVIVSDVGGSAEAVIHGQTGFVIARGDVQSLTATIKLLLDDEKLRLEMGRAGRDRFLAHFTFEKMLTSTIAVYAEALQIDSFPMKHRNLSSNE